MPFDITTLFAGAGAGVLGALAGAWATVRLGFGFQKRLQDEQHEFQKKLLQEQLAFQAILLKQQLDFEKGLSAQGEEEMQKRHAQMTDIISYLRDTLNTKIGFVSGHLSEIAARLYDMSKKN